MGKLIPSVLCLALKSITWAPLTCVLYTTILATMFSLFQALRQTSMVGIRLQQAGSLGALDHSLEDMYLPSLLAHQCNSNKVYLVQMCWPLIMHNETWLICDQQNTRNKRPLASISGLITRPPLSN